MERRIHMIRYSAFDQDDIPRVYGFADNTADAIQQCKLALKEYIQKRPWYKHKTYIIKAD